MTKDTASILEPDLSPHPALFSSFFLPSPSR